MWDLDALREMNDEQLAENKALANHLSALGDEAHRIAGEFGRVGEILTDIDRDFCKATSIANPKDLQLLFVATGLLCAKWIVMSNVAPLDFDFKHDPNERKRLEEHSDGDKHAAEENKDKLEKYKNGADKPSENGYRTVKQIVFGSVPYDATGKLPKKPDIKAALNPHPDGISGTTKHFLTMGHDPILGWFFGTVNIISFSSTLKGNARETYKIEEKGLKYGAKSTFGEEFKIAFDSVCEDHNRLPAAVFKQGLHLLSDKNCKIGLPIPLLDPVMAHELSQKGWNSVEAKAAIEKVLGKLAKNAGIIAVQFVLSFFINEIIKAIHLMLYDEAADGAFDLYQVCTRKILSAANCISSSSNVLHCALFGAVTKNPLEAAKRLDIGGFIETIHRLISDTKFIDEIKREYIRENLSEKILNASDFDWWYVNEEGEIEYE